MFQIVGNKERKSSGKLALLEVYLMARGWFVEILTQQDSHLKKRIAREYLEQ